MQIWFILRKILSYMQIIDIKKEIVTIICKELKIML